MNQVNVRLGKCPYSNKFESTINGVNKPFKETWELSQAMFEKGEDSSIVIDGESYTVIKALVQDERIIAEAHQKEIEEQLPDILIHAERGEQLKPLYSSPVNESGNVTKLEEENARLRNAMERVKKIVINDDDYSLVVDTGEVIIEIIEEALNT
jgi:hypothetical protein